MKGEVLQDTDDSQFHADESKPHAKAVPGSVPKGHVCIRINAALVLLAEPGATVGMKMRLWNIKTPRALCLESSHPSIRAEPLLWVSQYKIMSRASPEGLD